MCYFSPKYLREMWGISYWKSCCCRYRREHHVLSVIQFSWIQKNFIWPWGVIVGEMKLLLSFSQCRQDLEVGENDNSSIGASLTDSQICSYNINVAFYTSITYIILSVCLTIIPPSIIFPFFFLSMAMGVSPHFPTLLMLTYVYIYIYSIYVYIYIMYSWFWASVLFLLLGLGRDDYLGNQLICLLSFWLID